MRSILPAAWTLPDAITVRLGDQAGRQRAMHHGDHLLLVTHEPPQPGDRERRARLFWRRPDGGWESSRDGNGPAALQRHVEDYAARIDALEDRLQAADEADDWHAVLHDGTPLHRAVRNLHKTLQAARDAVPSDRDLLVARDRANDLERAAELLLSDAQVGLAYTTAKRSEEAARSGEALARVGHRINLLAATFLPLTAIASVFGMQMQHGLETRWAPWPFWTVLALGLAVGLALRGVIARSADAPAASGPATPPR